MSSVQSAAAGHLGQNSSAHMVRSRAAIWTLISFKWSQLYANHVGAAVLAQMARSGRLDAAHRWTKLKSNSRNLNHQYISVRLFGKSIKCIIFYLLILIFSIFLPNQKNIFFLKTIFSKDFRGLLFQIFHSCGIFRMISTTFLRHFPQFD